MMTPLWWMAGLSVATGLLASTLVGSSAAAEVWLGMIAPLAVASATWILSARTFRRHPEQLTAVMIAAFVAKLVLFGAYVALVIGVGHARPVPFAISFSSYFIALHVAEAVSLQRLFAERTSQA